MSLHTDAMHNATSGASPFRFSSYRARWMLPVVGALVGALAGVWVGACTPTSTPVPIAVPADEPTARATTTSQDTPAALDATRYCEVTADVFCPFYLRCGRMAVDSDDACRRAFAADCETRIEERWAVLARHGLLRLSSAGVEACRAHLATVACAEQLFELGGPCASIWEGLVEAGGPCGPDVESFVCAAGTACTLNTTLCGTCEAVLPLGAACDVDSGTCGPDAECRADGDARRCSSRLRAGDACTDGGPRCPPGDACTDGRCVTPTFVRVGDACDRMHRCPYRSVCRAGTCVAMAGPGERCDDVVHCGMGVCVEGRCAVRADGDTCNDDAACASALCHDGQCAAPALSRCLQP